MTPSRQEPKRIAAAGTLEAVVSDQVLKIKVSDSDTWLVEFKPGQSKIEVTGTAEAGFLRPTLTVRFEGEIDKKGYLQSEITELEIFTPQGKNALGLFANDGPTAKPIGKAAPGKYQIRGKITSLKEHDIAFAAGSKKIFGTLAENVEVKVSSEDFGYVHEGDEVKITGWYNPANKAAAGKPGQAFADELTITLAKPLVAAKKPARAVAKSSKSSKAAREAKEEAADRARSLRRRKAGPIVLPDLSSRAARLRRKLLFLGRVCCRDRFCCQQVADPCTQVVAKRRRVSNVKVADDALLIDQYERGKALD